MGECDGEFYTGRQYCHPCWIEIDLTRKQRNLIGASYLTALLVFCVIIASFHSLNAIERIVCIFLFALGLGITFIVDVHMDRV